MTSVLDPKELAAKLYLDSWRVTQMMSLLGKSVVDLGSGAGFPGLPIALEEVHTRVTLVDTSEKKAAFAAECIEKLGVKNAKAHHGKAEDLLATERCDVVVVRALSSVRENVRTLRKVRHSLKDLVMLKGPSWSREVRAGEREAERLGFTLDTVWEHELPEDMGKRAILIYRAPGGQGR
jgi:16S rRNA (guanine527-N7)-methyltransferase